MDTGSAILQVHPTRFCNLQCLHCYSSSGPRIKDALPLSALTSAIEDGAKEGYRVLGFSGGEPTLYPDLPEAARTARENGFIVTVTTNGTTLTRKLVEQLAPAVHLVAVSLDGKPQSHNVMRNSRTAFQRMESRLDLLREARVAFGFIFTLTQFNLDELPWALEYAISQGAGLLQVHPLEQEGRAKVELIDSSPDDVELGYGIALMERMQALAGDRIRLQFDLFDKSRLRLIDMTPQEGDQLVSFANPLIVEASGMVTPGQYGLSARYALGSLHEQRLPQLKQKWFRTGWPLFAELQNATLHQLEGSDFPYVNFHERLTKNSFATPESQGRLRPM